MKKVKCASHYYNEKLNQIIIDFPFLENIHPFYKDILNKEFDLNNYKIELNQINIVINSIIKIKIKYLKLLKYKKFRINLLNLPSINANIPTLTTANVNVEKLTSNLLFVGNTNFQNKNNHNHNNNNILQVIDTQSIFDHPLIYEIEIKSINTLTHLNCCIFN
ncbi:hypothetical protein ACTFIY_008224 [Dictyostelium cf. discoideum]